MIAFRAGIKRDLGSKRTYPRVIAPGAWHIGHQIRRIGLYRSVEILWIANFFLTTDVQKLWFFIKHGQQNISLGFRFFDSEFKNLFLVFVDARMPVVERNDIVDSCFECDVHDVQRLLLILAQHMKVGLHSKPIRYLKKESCRVIVVLVALTFTLVPGVFNFDVARGPSVFSLDIDEVFDNIISCNLGGDVTVSDICDRSLDRSSTGLRCFFISGHGEH